LRELKSDIVDVLLDWSGAGHPEIGIGLLINEFVDTLAWVACSPLSEDILHA
jgi:hypothetical protein